MPATYSSDPFMPGYTAVPGMGPLAFGDRWHWLYRNDVSDEQVKWERTESFNAGIEFGLLKNRINGSIDGYQRNTRNLNYYLLSGLSMPGTVPAIYNVGTITNTGVELVLNSVLVKTRNVFWELGINAAWNKNRITEWSIPGNPEIRWLFAGESAGRGFGPVQVHAAGFSAGTFYLKQQVYANGTLPLEGIYAQNPQGQLDLSEERYAGAGADPDYIVGINTSFKWHNLDINASVRSHYGQSVYHGIRSISSLNSLYHPSGYLSNADKHLLITGFENSQPYSDHYLSDASFLKVDYISAGYSFYRLMKSISRVRLYAAVQNIAVFTRYAGTDPEQIRGIEQYRYPIPSNLVFGLNIDF
jgi:TonB-dependent starch-binding outer membrane protein SusC